MYMHGLREPRRGKGHRAWCFSARKTRSLFLKAPKGRGQIQERCLRPFGASEGKWSASLALKRQAIRLCPFGAGKVAGARPGGDKPRPYEKLL